MSYEGAKSCADRRVSGIHAKGDQVQTSLSHDERAISKRDLCVEDLLRSGGLFRR